MKKLKNSKKLNIIIVSIILFVFSFAGIFDSKTVKMDTEKYIVYQSITVNNLLNRFGINKNLAKENDGNYFAVIGSVSSVSGKTLYIKDTSLNSTNLLKCTSSAISLQAIKNADVVCVYGQLSYSSISNELSITVNRIEKNYGDVNKDEFYSTLFGEKLFKKDLVKKSIGNNRITFYIPKEWKTVEHSIIGENLGTMDGYQYRLNEINNFSASPENLFVCYFDYSKLANESDINETKLIEKAIVANILKTKPENILGSFPLKSIKTYYNTDYHYYQNSFNKVDGKGYHLEFAFQPVDNNGMVVYLYVYENNNKNIETIMNVLRMTEF